MLLLLILLLLLLPPPVAPGFNVVVEDSIEAAASAFEFVEFETAPPCAKEVRASKILDESSLLDEGLVGSTLVFGGVPGGVVDLKCLSFILLMVA